MANPIKASDLFQDDGAIRDAVEQLKALKGAYDELIDDIRKNAARAEADIKKMGGATSDWAGVLDDALGKADAMEKQSRDFAAASKQVEEAIKKTEKAQEDQNEAIDEGLELTEEMEKALNKYAEALDDNQVKLQAVRMATQKMNHINKLEAKIAMSKKDSYNALSAQYSIMKIKLNDMSEAERRGTKAGQEMEKQALATYERMKQLQEATGKHTLNVGNYENSVKKAMEAQKLFQQDLSVGSVLTQAYQFAVAKLIQAKTNLAGAISGNINPLKALRLALISTGIGAIVVVLGSLIGAFLSTQRGADALARALGPLKAVVQGLLGLAQQLSFVFVDKLKAAFQDPVGAIKNLGSALLEWLLTPIRSIAVYGDALGKIFTGQFKEGFTELGRAARMTIGITDGMADAFGELANQVKKTAKESYDMGDAITDLTIKIRHEEIAFETLRAELERTIAAERALAANTEESSGKRIAALRKAEAASNDLAAGEIRLARMRLDLAKKQASLNDTDDAARLEIAKKQAEITRLEAANLNRKREMVAQISSISRRQAAAEAAAAKALSEEERKAREERLKGEESFNASIADLRLRRLEQAEQTFQREMAALEKTYTEQSAMAEKFGLDQTALMDATQAEMGRISAKYSEELKKQARERAAAAQQAETESFGQQQELERSRFDLTTASAADRARFELNAERDKLAKMLALNEKYQGDLTALQIETIGNQIKAIDQKLGEGAGGRTLADLLGFSPEEMGVMSDSFKFAKSQLDDYMRKRVEAANQAVQRSDNEVQAAQAMLQAELTAQAAGYASNVDRARKELDLAKNTQARALEQQRKAQRAQQQIQAATQAASLVTASANILKDFKLPFALLALAVMWGAFATAQVRAGQLTKKQYAKGGYEELNYGGSHASGNDNPLAMTRDGRERRAEKGEAFAVFTRGAVSKYRGVLPGLVNAINQGQLERGLPGADGLAPINVIAANADMGRTERELSAIRRQGERKIYTDANGRTVEIFKNRKTIYHA